MTKEEAIKIAYGISGTKAQHEALEFLIPELAESEDERIRKDILRFLKAKLENCTAPTPAKSTLSMWIDYLEKQKEDYSSFSEEQRKYMEKYISLDKNTLVKLLAERDRNVEETTKSFEKQEEQKPKERFEEAREKYQVEWSEEDEKMAYIILNLLCSQVTYVTGQGTTSGKQFPTYAKERDWFEKRFKSLCPQPHWKPSEEQMEHLQRAVNYYESDWGENKLLRILINDLKKQM